MTKTPRILSRSISLALSLAIILSQILPISNASAAQITTRSLTLMAGTTGLLDGGSKPSGVVRHSYTFTLPNAGSASIGSIKFQYCMLAAGICTMPSNMSSTVATLNTQTGATGFTIVNATNGSPYLTRAASAIPAGTQVSYTLESITNPDVTNMTFYVRITTYASIDTSGAIVDSGNVAASTATPIMLSGSMPESLVFCTGATIGLTAGVPDCATATAGAIDFNQLFSPTDTATATSHMAASTNAGGGYTITVNGTTMMSGSNAISPLGSASPIAHGVSQFGMNLKLNTVASSTVPVGAEVAVPSNGTNYRGEAQTGYHLVDNFRYVNGDPVAASSNGGLGGSDSQIYTVSYIVNVPGSQPAGTYTTTLTYICTPTF